MASRSPQTRIHAFSLVTLALAAATLVAAVTVAVLGRGYYLADPAQRVVSVEHRLYNPAGPVGLALGIGAAILFLSNLFYLLRKKVRALAFLGSLGEWLDWHVLSGLLGGLLVALHAGLRTSSAIGRAAVWSFVIVLVTGVMGRYMVRFIPRNRKGEQLSLGDLEAEVLALADALRPVLRRDPEGARILLRMVDAVDPRGVEREEALKLRAVLTRARRVRRDLARLRGIVDAAGGVAHSVELRRVLQRAGRLYRQVAVAHAVTQVMDSWRIFHRVLALLFIAAVAVHVWAAFYYGFVEL